MEKLSVGSVVLARFPFSDLSSKKVRPCLVIANAEFGDVILCQITSNQYDSRKAVRLLKSDFKSGSIVTDSFIRPDKIATLDRRVVVRVLGGISNVKQNEVKQSLSQLFEL